MADPKFKPEQRVRLVSHAGDTERNGLRIGMVGYVDACDPEDDADPCTLVSWVGWSGGHGLCGDEWWIGTAHLEPIP